MKVPEESKDKEQTAEQIQQASTSVEKTVDVQAKDVNK